MGMYDEFRVINIAHENFDSNHKNLNFQTKDLECELSEYCVFNGQLYLEAEHSGDGYVRHSEAIKSDHTGTVSIYTDVTRSKVTWWVEYDLVFENGMLIDVVSHGERIDKDERDLDAYRPSKPSNRVSITISISDCDEDKRQAVLARLTDEKIEALRELLEEPLATVSYPVKRNNDSIYSHVFSADYSNIVSVVQTRSDFVVDEDNKRAAIISPNGHRMILDELSGFFDAEEGATDGKEPRVFAIDEMHNAARKGNSERNDD